MNKTRAWLTGQMPRELDTHHSCPNRRSTAAQTGTGPVPDSSIHRPRLHPLAAPSTSRKMSESTPFGCALCVLCNHTVAITDGQLLRCGHAFHHECFTKWVSKRKTCPTCREPFHLISNLYPSAGSKCSQFKQPIPLPSTGLISDVMYSTQKRRQYLADLDSSLHVDQVELRDLFTMVKQSMILSRKLYFEGRFELSFRAIIRCRFLFFKMQARPQFNLFEKCNAGEVKTCEMALRVVDSAFGEAVDNLLKFHDRNVVDGCLSQQMLAQWQSLNPPDQQ